MSDTPTPQTPTLYCKYTKNPHGSDIRSFPTSIAQREFSVTDKNE